VLALAGWTRNSSATDEFRKAFFIRTKSGLPSDNGEQQYSRRYGNFGLVLQALRKIDIDLMVAYRFEWACAAVHRPTPAAFAGSSPFDAFRALIG
jgi:hypothetical protein